MNKNNLINEKSPYLLQHSRNPVNWYAWNNDTHKIAEETGKPIFLSIGYSTCYWCHVMERESFENKEIADLLNKYFINIKVDREERPDIDRVYMTALQSMTGAGGWPMNMFLTPDLKPFYGATYIPPEAKYGRAGFRDIIEQIHNLWENKKQEIITSSEKIYELLSSRLSKKGNKNKQIDDEIFEKSFETIKNVFDYENGGFGSINKFPRPAILNYLLSLYYQYNNTEALDMVTFTLKKMCEGGIYDHLGGGFHRYSVDVHWRVPHFEKMIYDQAQISSILFDVYSITKDTYFLNYGTETLDYVLKNLSNKNGGYFSAEDAESATDESFPEKKEEGYYYTWQKNQIEEILGKNDARLFCDIYGIKHEGNTISDPHNIFKNKNVLYLVTDIYDASKSFNKSPDEVKKIISKSKRALSEKRSERIRPHLDDKILTSWNSLMISAFARGYSKTKNEKYLESAVKCYLFIKKNLWREKEKVLYHRFRDNETKYQGTLEDYSFYVKALLDLYGTTFEENYLRFATEITDITIEKFYDKANSGFYDTEQSAKDVILRTKDIYDGAEPSGNSVMLENLFRLAYITGKKELSEIAEASLEYFYPETDNLHFSSPLMLNNILFSLSSPKEIIFTGNIKNKGLEEMIDYIKSKYISFEILIHATKELEPYSEYIREIVDSYDKIKVYVCENQRCNLPVDNTEDLKKIL